MAAPKNFARIVQHDETGFHLVLSPEPDQFFCDVAVHGCMRGDYPRFYIACDEGEFNIRRARDFAARLVIAADFMDRLGYDLPTRDELRAALVAAAPEIDFY